MGAKAYLLVYNLVQFLGWSYILWLAVVQYGSGFPLSTVYSVVEFPLKIFQTLAVLEVAHGVLGLVRVSAFTTLMQVFSRVFLVWAICDSTPEVTKLPYLFSMVIAWSVTEVIRYLFYALNLVGANPYWLTWMRYTFFIILYPVGASSECFLTYHALPMLKLRDTYSYHMPNFVNFEFDFYYVCMAILASYLPGFPHMYMHMFRQRRKVIGGHGKKKKAE